MIDVSEIVNDPDMCSTFSVKRTTGAFAAGCWQPNTSTIINTFGAVRNVSGKELEMIPEADRAHEAITVRTATQLFVTNQDGDQISDILQWQGANYRLLRIKQYEEQGYWYAEGVRMEGQ